MLTGKLKNQVDDIWEVFWTGGVTNPISVIEQFTYLLFIRRLDEIHTIRERKANATNKDIEDPIFTTEQSELRWKNLLNADPQAMFNTVKDKVFPFIKTINGEDTAFAKHMSDAIFMIPKPIVLDRVMRLIDSIEMKDRDTKGDLYEYMLSKLQSSGTNGQFRTPRHIIQMMVEMTQPRLGKTDKGIDVSDTICDPASGTCGFLMAAEEYVRKHYEEALYDKHNKQHFHTHMFNAYDFDQHMLRIGAMNLMLHGVEHPTVEYRDSLSDHGEHNIKDKYSLILANPPFKGSVAYDELSPDLISALGKTPKKASAATTTDADGNKKAKKGPSEKTELLFLALILRMLAPGGRAAVVVPDGVLFGSTKAHKAVRQTLLSQHKLTAVVSLPSGVFKPYAGVSTAVLFFTKTGNGGTDNVWFYDMQADGFSLDDKRTPLINTEQQLTTEADVLAANSANNSNSAPSEHSNHAFNNIPDIIYRWQSLTSSDSARQQAETSRPRTAQSFLVPLAEIIENDFDLSINRYKEVVYETVQYDPPNEILTRIKTLQTAMDTGIQELEKML